jgi:hypothetical protein
METPIPTEVITKGCVPQRQEHCYNSTFQGQIKTAQGLEYQQDRHCSHD